MYLKLGYTILLLITIFIVLITIYINFIYTKETFATEEKIYICF